MNVQNYSFSASFLKIHVQWITRSMIFFTYFTLIHLFFNCKPKQGSVKLFHDKNWTRVEYAKRTPLKLHKLYIIIYCLPMMISTSDLILSCWWYRH